MSDLVTDIVNAPFNPNQVSSLNSYQQASVFHEYTCKNNAQHPPLRATENGWICDRCGYIQPWALRMMTDWTWKQKMPK